jgi:hypothetical protein
MEKQRDRLAKERDHNVQEASHVCELAQQRECPDRQRPGSGDEAVQEASHVRFAWIDDSHFEVESVIRSTNIL